ncbi:haloacid dehalogenase [Asticcacaulis sp. AC460]|uniref:HAD family hydrolase n=1 Tax=Asticcacaulis sp. AC460 TaxID=1282360 RepID=UPI0003C3E140|nr:HAD family phosphatase [Asticcacaulis sp. AC460]ESQ89083.1 haloacid dehalogenase [Asticcacaulis sp. AC460]
MSLPAPPVLRSEVQALIFDCDGTLADTFAAHYRTFREALVPYKVEMTAAFYAARLGLSRRQLLAALTEETGMPVDDEDLRVRTPAMFLGHAAAIRAIPFSENLVRLHHGRLKLAVASAAQRPMVMASLGAIGLTDFFESIVTIEDTGVGKPAPDLFLKAATNLRVAPGLCHVFEDSDQGIEAAHRAGMTVTDIRPYYQSDPAEW